MKMYGRTDDNQREIVSALRKAGATVISLASLGNGCPDLLVGFRGVTYLFEVKDGSKSPSKRRLTELEEKFRQAWQGLPVVVVNSVEEALVAIEVIPF